MDDQPLNLFPTSGLRRQERGSHRRGGEVAHVEGGVALRRDRVLRRSGNHREAARQVNKLFHNARPFVKGRFDVATGSSSLL